MTARSQTRGRVLIVDDEPEMLEGMKILLGLEGIDVIIHGSMITLPLILRDADPDVVLLDISLPALSGTSALRCGLRTVSWLRTRRFVHISHVRSLWIIQVVAGPLIHGEKSWTQGPLPNSLPPRKEIQV
jgi:DNA-binding NarL/FixJ family response regulator